MTKFDQSDYNEGEYGASGSTRVREVDAVSKKEKKEALQKECNNFVSCTILRWFFGGAAFAFVVIDYINSKM